MLKYFPICKIFLASITAEKNTTSMTRWEPPTSSWAKLRCVDHIRDSLNMHVEVLVDFISVLPYIANNFDASQRKTLVTKSFMELIILRWTKTTKPTSGVITGVTGHNYSMKDMRYERASWTGCLLEFSVNSEATGSRNSQITTLPQ